MDIMNQKYLETLKVLVVIIYIIQIENKLRIFVNKIK